MWNTHKKIYEVPAQIERVNTCIQENETPKTSEICFSNNGINLTNYVSEKVTKIQELVLETWFNTWLWR